MYKLEIDSVPSDDRKYLSNNVCKCFKIKYIKGNKAIITYEEPYIMEEKDIIAKSKAIKELKQTLLNLRNYQFDKVKGY